MKVTDPQGRTWRVSRRWVPWRRRTRFPRAPDLPGSWLDDDAITTAITILFALPTLVMTAVALAEVALLLLLLPVLALGRVVLGRHWVVEVTSELRPVWEAEVGTWPQTRRAIASMASGLEQGIYPWDEQRGRPLADLDRAVRVGQHRREDVRPAPPVAPRRPGAPAPPPGRGSGGPGR